MNYFPGNGNGVPRTFLYAVHCSSTIICPEIHSFLNIEEKGMLVPGNTWPRTQACQEEEMLLLSSGDSSGVLVTLSQQRVTSLRMSTFSRVETL